MCNAQNNAKEQEEDSARTGDLMVNCATQVSSSDVLLVLCFQ